MEVSGRSTSKDHSKSLLYGSEDDIKLYCQPCDMDGPRVPAHGYCQDCTEHLCETCYQSHRKPAPCRNHVLLDKTQMPKSQSHSQHHIPHDLTEQCQQHAGKVIEYFYNDHNVLGCSPCITINHRNCKVDYIPDVSANFPTNPEYQLLRNSMKTFQDNLHKVINQAKANGKKIIENKTTIEDEIRRFRQEVNKFFDKLEAQLQQQTDDLFAVEIARIDSLATRSVKMLKDIETLQDDIDKLEIASKHNALYIKTKTNEVSVKSCTSAILEMQDNNFVDTYLFESNKVIENMLKSETKIAQLFSQLETASHSIAKHEYLWRDLLEELSAGVILRSEKLYEKLTATPAGEINVKLQTDKVDCCIAGVVVIDNDTVAVADSSNIGLKIVESTQKKVFSTKYFSSQPVGIEILPGGQLVVTLPNEQRILFLSIPKGLSEVRRLKVDGKCSDLAYCDGKLVVTFRWPGKVQIMDEKGHIFRTIETDFFGNTFKCPFVTTDRNKSYIYVSDWTLQTVTRFNWEGQVINGYKAESLIRPYGLVTLNDGSLLVCSSGNNSIHQISPNFDKGRVILEQKHGLKCPYSLDLNAKQNTLFVGSGQNLNFVKMFDLKHITFL